MGELIEERRNSLNDFFEDCGSEENGREVQNKIRDVMSLKIKVDWEKYTLLNKSAIEGDKLSKKSLNYINEELEIHNILTSYDGFEIKGFEFYVERENDKLRFEKRTEASKLARVLGIPISDIEYVY